MADHEHYAELCAGAAADIANSRHLTEVEWNDLIQHLGECVECQELLNNFLQVSFQLLEERTPAVTPMVAAGRMQHRNLVRLPVLHDERPDCTLSRRRVLKPRRARLSKVLWGSVMIGSLAICFVLGAMFGLRRNTTSDSSHGNAHQTSPALNTADKGPSVQDLNSENSRLSDELRSAEQKEASLTVRLQESDAALAAAQAREAKLTSRIAELEKANSESANKESAAALQIAQLRSDLQALRAESEVARKAAAEAQAELLERGGEVKKIAAQLEEERKLNATLSEAQEFLENPDSHVLPIYDHDENGQVLFGRILYTEGKKLVFYAYNLPDGRVHGAEVSFYVWGEKPGTHQPVRNLGILRADGTKANRWKLEFKDTNVLAKIDTVFVTAESGKAAVEPRGKRMFEASLDLKAVH